MSKYESDAKILIISCVVALCFVSATVLLATLLLAACSPDQADIDSETAALKHYILSTPKFKITECIQKPTPEPWRTPNLIYVIDEVGNTHYHTGQFVEGRWESHGPAFDLLNELNIIDQIDYKSVPCPKQVFDCNKLPMKTARNITWHKICEQANPAKGGK